MGDDEVFLDTSGLVALVNADDRSHQEVQVLSLELLEKPRARLITTYAVLIETAELLRSRLLKKGAGWSQIINAIVEARDFALTWRENRRAEILPIGEALWLEALDLMASRTDKDWGLTDCISFVVMRERRILSALTSDKHFEQAGFRALLRG